MTLDIAFTAAGHIKTASAEFNVGPVSQMPWLMYGTVPARSYGRN